MANAGNFFQYKGGSAAAIKIRLAGSFLFDSVFTITAIALISTFCPLDFWSEEWMEELFEKLLRSKIQQAEATSFFIDRD